MNKRKIRRFYYKHREAILTIVVAGAFLVAYASVNYVDAQCLKGGFC